MPVNFHRIPALLLLVFLTGSLYPNEKNVRRWVKLGSHTRVALPNDFNIGSPKHLYFENQYGRLDLYSRSFSQGELVYIEVRKKEDSFGFTSNLTAGAEKIILSRASYGYRGFFPIRHNESRDAIDFVWQSGTYGGTEKKKLSLKINKRSFKSSIWYYRVSSIPRRVNIAVVKKAASNPGSKKESGPARNEESEKKKSSAEKKPAASTEKKPAEKKEPSEFMRKIMQERKIKKYIFSSRRSDLISPKLAHPRDMHYITDPIFTRRLRTPYIIENGKKVPGPPRVSVHNGVDLRGAVGTPIYAMASGLVTLTRPMHFEGNFTVIDHGNGIFTGYMHQNKIYVKEGQYVTAGQLIGEVGDTGFVTGPHLHMAMWVRGVPVDPLSLLCLPVKD